jgi:hypothetical protein
MIDHKTRTIYFPNHVFPGSPRPNILSGKEHTINSINGGYTKIEDFGFRINSFFGGNCLRVGMIKEYGFYAFPDRMEKQIMGFFVGDGTKVTELGKKILKERFPDYKIVYGEYHPAPTVEDDPDERQRLIKEFQEAGGNPVMVRTASAEVLVDLIRALRSGESKRTMAEAEIPAFAPAAKEEEVVAQARGKGKPPKEAVDSLIKKAQQKARNA